MRVFLPVFEVIFFEEDLAIGLLFVKLVINKTKVRYFQREKV